MAYTATTKKILMSLAVTPTLAWRDNAVQFGQHNILETALLLPNATLDERRELYRLLKETPLVTIPFVQLALDTEEWELQYLIENYGTHVFGLPTKTLSFSLLSRLPNYLPYFAFENPAEGANQDLFTDEALARSGVKGVCLDVATLENDRNHNEKKYNKTIHTLDHHPLLVTKVGPVPSAWYKRIIKSDKRRLTSLSDLHYIKHVPSSYLGSLIVLGVDNAIEEQLEIKEYLNLLLT